MSMEQIAVNSRAIRSAALRLEGVGYQGDCVSFVESLVLAVIADGWRPIDKPPPLHGATSTEEGRRRARELFEQTRDAKGGRG